MVKSQLSYCPLIWMFRSRNANNLINKIQERSPRLITNDKVSTFEHLSSIVIEGSKTLFLFLRAKKHPKNTLKSFRTPFRSFCFCFRSLFCEYFRRVLWNFCGVCLLLKKEKVSSNPQLLYYCN